MLVGWEGPYRVSLPLAWERHAFGGQRRSGRRDRLSKNRQGCETEGPYTPTAPMSYEFIPPNERITPNDSGGVDEIVRFETWVHVEQMSDDAYWMNIGEDHFDFVLEGPPGKQRIELYHRHDDEPAVRAVKCCCVDGPASTGREDPLKAGECGHCHCYSYYTDQGATGRKRCCWCRYVLPVEKPDQSPL